MSGKRSGASQKSDGAVSGRDRKRWNGSVERSGRSRSGNGTESALNLPVTACSGDILDLIVGA